jgi:predicted nucleic acid-binding protein
VILIADTSGVLAAFDTAHPHSDAAYRSLRDAALTVFSPLVIAELDHVGRRVLGRATARQVIEDITRLARRGDFALAQIDPDHVTRAHRVQDCYADLALDLADAVNVALAEEYETDSILTLDQRDFRAILPLTEHKAFRLFPIDG